MRIPLELIILFLSVLFGGLGTGLGVLLKVLNRNTEAITEINTTLARYEEQNKRDKEQETYIKNKLEKHANTLQSHEIRITKLEDK